MIFKNISKSKLTLAFISIAITFFVWQQGLRDSLNRPSVSFDISQKELEITELSVQSIPVNLKKFFIIKSWQRRGNPYTPLFIILRKEIFLNNF